MENRRVLLAVLLSLVVLIGWQYLFPASPPTAPEGPAEVEAPADPTATGSPGAGTAAEGAPREGSAAAGSEGSDPAAGSQGGAGVEEAPPTAPRESIEASRPEEVVVDTELFRAVFTNRGAQLRSFILKNHRSYAGGQVDLVRKRAAVPYPFGLVDGAGQPLALDDVLFTVERRVEGGVSTVVFRYSGEAGVAEKRFRFLEDGLFDVAVRVEDPAEWALFAGPGIRNPSTEESESRYERPAVAYEVRGGDVERLEAEKLEGIESLSGAGLQWVGVEDTYFLAAFMPQVGLASVEVVPYLLEPTATDAVDFRQLPPGELSEEQEELGRELGVMLRAAGDELEMQAYWGAKKYQRLAGYEAYDLERTINIWSWFRPIAVPILWALLWIHDNMVHNYGWAIVLVTVLIKLILAPLTHKSFVSMRKMQELNPQMQAIRAKWRGKLRDKNGKMNLEAQRQMNEEMQQLYRTAGVNPAGGCLPMLLQMPVLFAFYQLLTAAVELRGAPWILWIHDLSQPDPFYALPIIMGATQFLQQRLTPMAGDPMQRKIMQAMPVIWTVFFLGFPSGLVLYWLTNNVLTILQQWAMNRFMPSTKQDEPAPGDKKGSARKGSKGSRRVASK